MKVDYVRIWGSKFLSEWLEQNSDKKIINITASKNGYDFVYHVFFECDNEIKKMKGEKV